jgi:HAD superfamily phosphoserine phosphatase-like hydrolase
MRTAFCFDIDGTVTKSEVLACIAPEIKVSDEVATLTCATMEGHIAFEASLKLRCLILGQVPTEKVCKIVADIQLDESIFYFICEHTANSFLVTGHLDIWVRPIVEKCGCEIYSSTGFVETSGLKMNKILSKGDAVSEIRSLGYERIVAIGGGANDVSMLAAADIGIAFGGCHAPSPAAISVSDYIIHKGAALCRMLQVL